jgi:tetratricopeptide (TPR) repeat protein
VEAGNNGYDEKAEEHYVRKPKHLILQATTEAQKQPQHIASNDVKVDAILNQFYQAKNEKRLEDAKRLIEMAIEQAPDDIRARKEAGYLLLESHPVIALEHFKHVEKLDPADVLNIVQIGYLLQKLNRQMEAYTQFDKAFETVKTTEEKKSITRIF